MERKPIHYTPDPSTEDASCPSTSLTHLLDLGGVRPRIRQRLLHAGNLPHVQQVPANEADRRSPDRHPGPRSQRANKKQPSLARPRSKNRAIRWDQANFGLSPTSHRRLHSNQRPTTGPGDTPRASQRVGTGDEQGLLPASKNRMPVEDLRCRRGYSPRRRLLRVAHDDVERAVNLYHGGHGQRSVLAPAPRPSPSTLLQQSRHSS